MQLSNITFQNFHGYTQDGKGNRTASVGCSKVFPCFGILLEDVRLASSANGSEVQATGTCSYTAPGGVVGLVGC